MRDRSACALGEQGYCQQNTRSYQHVNESLPLAVLESGPWPRHPWCISIQAGYAGRLSDAIRWRHPAEGTATVASS